MKPATAPIWGRWSFRPRSGKSPTASAAKTSTGGSRRPSRRRRSGTAMAGRVAMADSKALYHSGGGLRLLERGLWAAFALLGHRPRTASGSLGAVGAGRRRGARPEAGYCGDDLPLPLDADAGELDALGPRLQAAFSAAGVRLLGVRSRAIFPRQFNDLLQECGSKGLLFRGRRWPGGRADRVLARRAGRRPLRQARRAGPLPAALDGMFSRTAGGDPRRGAAAERLSFRSRRAARGVPFSGQGRGAPAGGAGLDGRQVSPRVGDAGVERLLARRCPAWRPRPAIPKTPPASRARSPPSKAGWVSTITCFGGPSNGPVHHSARVGGAFWRSGLARRFAAALERRRPPAVRPPGRRVGRPQPEAGLDRHQSHDPLRRDGRGAGRAPVGPCGGGRSRRTAARRQRGGACGLDGAAGGALRADRLGGSCPGRQPVCGGAAGRGRSGIRFGKGAICAIRFEGPPQLGGGQLRWLATAKVLGC